ncbi:MAG: TauD/TfdA family dioxygenase [Alphaproteobacteria bacterium]|nr:TauD/TfdA family dioxygenase [Alphaproteobacteria bacterium]
MSEVHTAPISDKSVWTGATLEADRSWEYEFSAAQVTALEDALAGVRKQGLSLPEVNRDNFPLPELSTLLSAVSSELRAGRGFALMHGFPVAAHDYDDRALLYWGLCSHIGVGITQNSEAGFIHYVTDGALRPQQGKRGVGFPKESRLHVDLMDIVTLLCARQAKDDPHSWVASSTMIHNEVARRRPDALPRLYEGFEWGRMDEHGAEETATSGYKVPLFSNADGFVSCQYNRAWINNANTQRKISMPDDDSALLDLIDDIAADVRLEIPFHAGDIQFCNNYTVLHGRAAHAQEPNEDQKRVLMRIWLDMPDFRKFTDEAIIRHGIGRHGQLGWTAADIAAGRNAAPRQRRADGAVSFA